MTIHKEGNKYKKEKNIVCVVLLVYSNAQFIAFRISKKFIEN